MPYSFFTVILQIVLAFCLLKATNFSKEAGFRAFILRSPIIFGILTYILGTVIISFTFLFECFSYMDLVITESSYKLIFDIPLPVMILNSVFSLVYTTLTFYLFLSRFSKHRVKENKKITISTPKSKDKLIILIVAFLSNTVAMSYPIIQNNLDKNAINIVDDKDYMLAFFSGSGDTGTIIPIKYASFDKGLKKSLENMAKNNEGNFYKKPVILNKNLTITNSSVDEKTGSTNTYFEVNPSVSEADAKSIINDYIKEYCKHPFPINNISRKIYKDFSLNYVFKYKEKTLSTFDILKDKCSTN